MTAKNLGVIFRSTVLTVLAVLCLSSGVNAANILFLTRTVSSGVPNNGQDIDAYNFIEALGHTMTAFDSDDDFVGGGGNFADYDAIILSSTAHSGNVRNNNPTLKDTTVGILSWEYDYFNNDNPTSGNADQDVMMFEITGASTNGSEEEAIIDIKQAGDASGNTPLMIDLVGGTHDIMFCLANGLVPILDGIGSHHLQSIPTAGLGAGVTAIAMGDGNAIDNDGSGAGKGTGTGSDRSFILYADTGDALRPISKDGIANSQPTAPGRRLFFPLDNSNFQDLTDEGHQLFSNSLSWVLDETPTAEFVSHTVPEPSSIALIVLSGLFGAAVLRRRQTA